LNKSNYIVGEPVFFEIEAINKSNQGLAFDPFLYNQIIILDSQNKIYKKNIIDDFIYYENFQPGDTLTRWLNFTSEYGEPFENSRFFYLPAVEYSVFIDFNDLEKKVNITTEKLFLKVKVPDMYHQKILDKLILANSLPPASKEEAIGIYDELIRDYPKNLYSPIIYAKRLLKEEFTEKAKSEQFRQLCLKAIYELPANPYVTSYIGTLISHYRKIKDRDNLEKTLQKIIQDDLSERTTLFAKKMYFRIGKVSFEEFMKNEY
jgi:hypothetical protein